ncbi:hypothetical protein [Salinimonas chungwhensis]|uniref:hypothetical protein n=1 Tax=Salinimonas chungwhensis TaxID=265425 RepID=UPI0003735F44|nr:hypothetical protein [Salinimonas chungwhensis]
MKIGKIAIASLLSGLLSACGGHGYEGTWKATSDNAMLEKLISQSGAGTLVIGDDFIEANGQRNNVDEIFTRESGGKQYLVFAKGEDEQTFEITDDDNLEIGQMGVTLTYKRAD